MTFKPAGPVKVTYGGTEIEVVGIVKIETKTPCGGLPLDPPWLTEWIQDVADHLPDDFIDNRLGLARRLVSAEI